MHYSYLNLVIHLKGRLIPLVCASVHPYNFLQKHLNLYIQKAKGPQKHKSLNRPYLGATCTRVQQP